MEDYEAQVDFVNIFESSNDVCVSFVGYFHGRAGQGQGLCDKFKELGAATCGTYAVPKTPEAKSLHNRFPTLAFMKTMGERAGHIMSVGYQKESSAEQANASLVDTSAVLHDLRAKPGNIFANVIQGTGETSPLEFVWIEEWSSDADLVGLEVPKQVYKSFKGSLIDLNPPVGGKTDRSGPWTHVGGMR